MVLFNYSTKELTAKIVYYGPGLCGKTTNLQYIHGNLPGNVKGKMLSLATKTDRTLFFDFLPIDLGEIRGMKTRVQLYTVPGQVFYNETRKLVLKGADGLVFVADSQEQMLSANAESFKNLEENLKGHGLSLAETPHVIQFNKRDLPKLATIEQLNQAINKYNAPFYESVATTGIGVQDTLKAITKLVLLHLTKKYDPRAGASPEAQAKPAAPAAPAAPIPAIQTPAPGPAETQAIPLASIQPTPDAPTIAVASEQLPQPTPEPAMAATVEPAAPVEAAIPVQPVAPVEQAIPVEPAPPAPAPQFDDNEIEELVGEVEDLEEISAPALPVEEPVAAARESSPFEIDDSNIAQDVPVEEPPSLSVSEPEPPQAAAVEIEAPDLGAGEPEDVPVEMTPEAPSLIDEPVDAGDDEVVLTEVASGAELFDDPNLDVASVAPGEVREILIPVEMGPDGETKRFKLSVRLRLDPVD